MQADATYSTTALQCLCVSVGQQEKYNKTQSGRVINSATVVADCAENYVTFTVGFYDPAAAPEGQSKDRQSRADLKTF